MCRVYVDIGMHSHSMEIKHLKSSADEPAFQVIAPAVYGHGLAGAALILMGYLLAYLIGFELILGNWATPFVLMVVVAVMVMVCLTVRREEGQLKFGRALGLSLLSGFLARSGYNLFNVLLLHIMRPDLKEAYVDLVIERSGELIRAFGGSMAMEGMDLDAVMRESTQFSLSLTGQFVDLLWSSVWLLFVALVVAAILQRNRQKGAGFGG